MMLTDFPLSTLPLPRQPCQFWCSTSLPLRVFVGSSWLLVLHYTRTGCLSTLSEEKLVVVIPATWRG
jgi:hypothetical protein